MKEITEKYKVYFPAAFFVGGFVFDLLTLARIDESFQLIQQFLYLVVTGLLLVADKSERVEATFLDHPILCKIWSIRHEVIHFLLGSLLSAHAIFYFKSASLWNSFVFISFLSVLFVLNEFGRFEKIGSIIRFALFALCSSSYFIYLVPIVWQHIGLATFLFSIVLSGIFYSFFVYLLSKKKNYDPRELMMGVTAPGIAVHVCFVLFYVFSFLPPVPLSIEKIGIYHGLEKVEGQYHLFYERDWWRFWEQGAQTFLAHPGDRVHCFASVYAPKFFKERVTMEWWFSTRKGWKRTDSVPIHIVGGRNKGFRGYVVKQNYDEGKWQVRVVTSDKREIGRIYLNIIKDSNVVSESREYKTDIY